MMSRPDGWVSWKEARVEHGLTYKFSELQISKDNRHGSNEVLCFVGLDEDQEFVFFTSLISSGE